MRQPHHSLQSVPRHAHFRSRVRPVLEQYLAAYPGVLAFIGALHDGGTHPPEGILPSALRGPNLGDLRMKLALTMGVPHTPELV